MITVLADYLEERLVARENVSGKISGTFLAFSLEFAHPDVRLVLSNSPSKIVNGSDTTWQVLPGSRLRGKTLKL